MLHAHTLLGPGPRTVEGVIGGFVIIALFVLGRLVLNVYRGEDLFAGIRLIVIWLLVIGGISTAVGFSAALCGISTR